MILLTIVKLFQVMVINEFYFNNNTNQFIYYHYFIDESFPKSRLISRDSQTVYSGNDSNTFHLTVEEDELQKEIISRKKQLKNVS